MRRFSSRSTRTTFSRCRLHVLPTIVTTGANESASMRRASSSSAAASRRRVMPNAASSAVEKDSRASSENSSASLGFEAGKPASISGTPRSSSTCATRTFSAAESDMPSPCIPSRRVQS